jgi:signal transduction histidine kinase
VRASLLLVAGTAAALAAAVGALYGVRDGVLTWVLLTAVGAPALLLAHAAARRRERLGSLRRQFAVAVGLAAGQLVVVAVVAVLVMFVSTHDALFAVVVAVLAGVVAVRAMQVLGRPVLRDVEELRATLAAVARPGGPEPEADDELAALAASARRTIVALDRSEAARRNLVAAVSHDLRTPITSLTLLAHAIDDDIVDGATRRRYVREMRTHIGALSALIDDLFELSRLEAGDVAWSLEQVDLGQLVAETVDAMRAEAKAHGVRVEAAGAVGDAQANPEKLQRVLFNLLQNAIRHTPPDGSVVVRAEQRPGSVEIEVADTGRGIPVDDRELVFEPFFRGGAEAARTRTGAGLGLAICRAIVEAHGGRIWLAGSDVGTRVRFSLPA